MTPDDFCRHFKAMRENYYLKISYSIYECFVYQFDRISVMLNYKEDEINVLEEKAWFDKYLKQFNVNKTNWKNCSSYKIYDLIGWWWQKFEKNAEFVINRQRGPEPCTKKFDEKCCRYCENDNCKQFEKSLGLVEEGEHSLSVIIEEGEIIEIFDKE